MAREHGEIRSSIWNDEDFLALSASAKLVYMFIASQAKISLAGVIDERLRPWAKKLGIDPADMEAALVELDDESYIIRDLDTEEVALRTFVKHALKNLNNAKMCKGFWSAWQAIDSNTIRRGIMHNLPADKRDALGKHAPEGVTDHLIGQVTDHVIDHPTDHPTDPKDKETGDWRLENTPAPNRSEPPAHSVQSAPSGDGAVVEAFEDFWQRYPRRNGKRVDKAKALAQWKRCSQRDRALASSAVDNYAQSDRIPKDAHRWLRDKNWEDWATPEIPDPPKPKQPIMSRPVER